MLVILLRTFMLAALFAERAVSQYITRHPLGGFSYNHFHRTLGYNYITPSGQMVNVKFSTLAPTTYNLQSTAAELSPVTPAHFVFHSDSSALPFTTSPIFNSRPEVSLLQRAGGVTEAPGGFGRPPAAESLFVRAQGVGPVESEKQLQAYNDYVKQLAEENAGISVSEATESFGKESSSFSSFKNL